MDQSDTDWSDWPLGDNADIDAMIDAYKADGLSDDIKPDLSVPTPELPSYDEDFNLTGSAESEESEDEEEEEEPAPAPPPPRPVPPKPTPKPVIKAETNGTSLPTTRVPNGIGMHRSEYYQAVASQDGMATCEFCGRVGVRHAFYSKSKRFCTLGCSKSYSAAQKDKGKKQQLLAMKAEVQAKQAAAAAAAAANAAKKKALSPNGKTLTRQESTFDWNEYLSQNHVQAAPVSCFQHCPMADSWDCITVGMKVEVINTDCPIDSEVYWIASVIKLAGYKALMRYEGFANDTSHDFWINLCTQDVHPVGWCATEKKPLVPPQTIQHKYDDWKDFLVKRLTGARTLPHSFYSKVQESLNEHPIKVNMKVEVVDKTCVSAMRVATVDEIIGGRLRLQYVDNKDKVDEFWCHRESPLVHHVGWSPLIGHKLHATPDYKSSALNKIAMKKFSPSDTTPNMFPKPKDLPSNGLQFQSGMKLEAIDPLNLASVCTATVMKVFRHSYLMIGIDGSMAENGSDWFCYHASSACIFPVGFCEINDIPLTPPRGYKGEFKWFDYLKQTKSVAAPVKLFDREVHKHGFKVGAKVEAVDLMEPRLICVGTVTKVVGRLLRVHFDGWESSYDQWIDCQSPDIYPVGWCEMVGYPLEGPKPKGWCEMVKYHLEKPKNYKVGSNFPDAVSPLPPLTPRKRKTKSQIYRGPRKKRKPKAQACKGRVSMLSQGSVDTDDLSQDSNSTTDGSQNLGSSMASSSFGEAIIKMEPAESQNDSKVNVLLKSMIDEKPPVTENGAAPPTVVKMEVVSSPDLPALTSPVVTMSSPVVSAATTTAPIPRVSAAILRPSQASVTSSMVTAISASPSALTSLMSSNAAAAGASLPIGAGSSPGLKLSSGVGPVVTGASAPQQPTPTALSGITTVLSLPGGGQTTLAAVPRTLTTSAVLAPAVTIATTSGTVTKIAVPLSSSDIASLTGSTGSVYAITAQGVTKQQDQQGGGGRPSLGGGAHIPRVIPGEPDKECGYTSQNKEGPITPDLWGVYDVCQFLRINDCGAYCDSFSKKNICGRKFMTLTKEQIVNLTGMKVGPSLKIYDLIQQLKIAVAAQQQAHRPPTTPQQQQQQQQQQHQQQPQQQQQQQQQQPNLLTSPVHHQVGALSSPQVAQHSATLQRMMMSTTPTSQATALKAQLTQSTGLSLS